MVVKKKSAAKKTAKSKNAVKKNSKKVAKKAPKMTKKPKMAQKAKKLGKVKKSKKAKSVKQIKEVKIKVKSVKTIKPVKVATKVSASVGAKKPQSKPVEAIAVMSNKVKPTVSRPVMRQQTSSNMFDDVVMPPPSPRKKATTLLGALEFTPYQPKADEAYMSDHQRDHFRKILNAWKQQLMQDVDLTVGHLKEEAVFYADPVDRASQEEGFNLELRTRDRERKLIKKIEQSLDLITSNEYGYCEDCGAEIGIRRLEARPTAVKCIDCKTFQEIREKQLGG